MFFIVSDFDECQIDGTCSQTCNNIPGSYQCSCVKGYRLKPDGRGCKALGMYISLLQLGMQKLFVSCNGPKKIG